MKINFNKVNVPDFIKLGAAQLEKLTKDQLEGREPIYIRGVAGYLGGDKVWVSVDRMNKIKKQRNKL